MFSKTMFHNFYFSPGAVYTNVLGDLESDNKVFGEMTAKQVFTESSLLDKFHLQFYNPT